jgi:hypothetical protein
MLCGATGGSRIPTRILVRWIRGWTADADQTVTNMKTMKNIKKISWFELSQNRNAIHLLEKNIHKVNWFVLSKNPNAIPILEKNLDRVDWPMLSLNPNAMPLLEKNQEKIF